MATFENYPPVGTILPTCNNKDLFLSNKILFAICDGRNVDNIDVGRSFEGDFSTYKSKVGNNLPDLRERYVVGTGLNNSGITNHYPNGGATFKKYYSDNYISHKHKLYDFKTSGVNIRYWDIDGINSNTGDRTLETSATSSTVGDSNVTSGKCIALNYWIRVF